METAIDKYEQGIKELGISVKNYNVNISGSDYPYQVVSFKSCEEMISQLQKGIKDYKWSHKNFDDTKDYKPHGKDHEWAFGTLKNYDKTLEYLSEGKVVDSVLKKANQVYETLISQPPIEELMLRAATFKRQTVFREEGAELCIDRILCGDPYHWSKQTKGRKNPLVRIGVNLAGNCGENESLFNNITAVAGVVADLLSKAGFAVQVEACSTGYGTTDYKRGRSFFTTTVTLKNANESLDLQRIYSVGCSGYFRCWIFQVMCNIYRGNPYGSLGQTRPINRSMQDVLELDYIIDSSFRDAMSQHIHIEKMFNEIIEHHT